MDDMLIFAAEPIHAELGGTDDRSRALDRVARWLVHDLSTRGGVTNADELTDAAFAVIHPELGGRRIAAGESALVNDWRRIRRELVEPSLTPRAQAATTTAATPVTGIGLPPLGGAKVPTGYKRVLRNGVAKGLAKYGGGALEAVLRPLVAAGKVQCSADDLDTFKRISNVETGGLIQALNTWDSAVVSIGFFQLTLQHGKLQRWIARAPAAFARYGIVLEPTRKYAFAEPQRAIVGAPTTAELRWNGWAQRFYQAGLDPEVIAAEVELGKTILAEGLKSAARYLQRIDGAMPRFRAAYDGSLPLRGLYQEALNNKPVGARNGLQRTMTQVLRQGATTPAAVYEIAKREFLAAFVALNDPDSGTHVVEKTARGL